MRQDEVREVLEQVLAKYQESAQRPVPLLRGDSRPGEDCDQLDSKEWPAVTAIIEVELGFDLPQDLELFSKGKEPRTLDEMAALICKFAPSVA